MGRLILNRVPMKKRDPKERIKTFEEVALGYTPEEAIKEAERCILCKRPPCVKGCPVNIDIPAFIALIQQGKFVEASKKIKENNPLPAMCGRVCPQEEQCEEVCIIGKKGEPVAIGRLERFVADYEAAQGEVEIPEIPPPTGFKVAVIGSGPSGLVCASELVQMGHKVTIFEALHKPGGVLMYGIPQFRLPKEIVAREIDYVKRLGVEIVTNFIVGKTMTLDELREKEGFDAFFVGTGAGYPRFMGIPGENLLGIYSANEFLTRVNLMKAYMFPEYDTPVKVGDRVIVVGAGNVAMDAARCALRSGASEVTIVYRRSWKEMTARIEEIENAKEEGIKFMILHNPVAFYGDESGWVRKAELIKMELGEPDESGRRRPVPIKGSEFRVPVDTVVEAIGQVPNPVVPQTTPGLKTTRWGTLVSSPTTGATTKEGVFTGGDIMTGAATVILAAGTGKVAAKYIDYYLRNRDKPGVWEELTKDIKE
ncbi:MAG: NADPH-dependent glutamate synthase [Candidatus Hydrothermae bacterium]|nr:NADPH-dependent glutamate synthase [Candidatus Hydrothermae bacterium]